MSNHIRGWCARCHMPGHRYGTTDPEHEPNVTACINSLTDELRRYRRAVLDALIAVHEDYGIGVTSVEQILGRAFVPLWRHYQGGDRS